MPSAVFEGKLWERENRRAGTHKAGTGLYRTGGDRNGRRAGAVVDSQTDIHKGTAGSGVICRKDACNTWELTGKKGNLHKNAGVALREREWSQGTVRWTRSVRAALDGMTWSTLKSEERDNVPFPASPAGAGPGRARRVIKV